MSTETLVAILSSAVLASFINQIFETIRQSKKRKETLEDRENGKNNWLCIGVRLLLLDKIRWLGGKAIDQGEISFEDRKLLNDMHECYHTGLDGNGDAKIVIGSVNTLPLKH